MRHNKLLLLILGIILLGEAVTTGLLPITQGDLFGALNTKSPIIWMCLVYFFINYLALDLFQSFKSYMILRVSLWYRDLRTNSIINKIDNSFDNLPQRIQEDIKLSYTSRINVWCEYFVSGAILFQLIMLNVSEPLLVGGALAYALISVMIALLFNPRLTKAEIAVQQAEASFRTSLIELATNLKLLPVANKACLMAAKIRTEYLLFTKAQLAIVLALPYAVLIPKLLAGKIDLGQLVEHQSTFSLIVVNAAVLIQLYPILIQGNASEHRVREITDDK